MGPGGTLIPLPRTLAPLPRTVVRGPDGQLSPGQPRHRLVGAAGSVRPFTAQLQRPGAGGLPALLGGGSPVHGGLCGLPSLAGKLLGAGGGAVDGGHVFVTVTARTACVVRSSFRSCDG